MRNSILQWGKNFSLSKAGLIAGLILAISACNSQPDPVDNQSTFVISDTMLTQIALSKATMQPVKAQIKLIGKVVADDNKLVEVFPLVGGYVTTVNVELGDYVKKGQILAIIRSSEVADFERQLIDAQSDLLVAQKNQKIAEDLFSGKLTSEKDVLAARKEVERAQAELDRINEVFQIYGITKKAEYELRAPISGFVVEKRINRDMQLRSDKGDYVFTIAEISDVWVNANVYETDISKVYEGMEAEVKTISYPDTIFHGDINKIYNMLDPVSKTMKVRIRLPNSAYMLKPEMNATVTLKYSEKNERIALPSSAIIFDKSKNYVMVFHDKFNIETREVQLDKQVGDTTYLIKGLSVGEEVISKNQLLIYDALND
jgi:cobalt-zinc-cadmium efflux system membrane fusion protein